MIQYNKIKSYFLLFLIILTPIWLISIFYYYSELNIKYIISNDLTENYFTDKKVLSVIDYNRIDNKFWAVSEDPQIFILPPALLINEIFIELNETVINTSSLQLFYAVKKNNLSEANSIIIPITPDATDYSISLPPNVYTKLRFDFDIFNEPFEIKGIYFSNLKIVHDTNIIYAAIIISIILIIVCFIGIKKVFLDKLIYNHLKMIGFIKDNYKLIKLQMFENFCKYKKRNFKALFMLLTSTWVLCLINYFFSSTSYLTYFENNFDKEKSVSIYPQNLLETHGYSFNNNEFYVIASDPQIYIKPPQHEVSSTLIEFNKQISVDSFIQIYYATDYTELSEENSVIIFLPKGHTEVAINLPKAQFTTLRYDIDIHNEKFVIKDIYFSENETEIKYVCHFIGNKDVFLMTLIIDLFLIVFWFLTVITCFIDRIFLKVNNFFFYINKNKKRVFLIFVFLFGIILLAFIIEFLILCLSNNNYLSLIRILFFIVFGFVLFCIYKFRGKPEKIFVFISLLIGFLYIISVPAFIRISVDEETHYYRAVEQSYAFKVSFNISDNKFINTLPISYLDINFFDKKNKDEYLEEINSKYNKIVTNNYYKKNFDDYFYLYNKLGYIPSGLMIFLGRSLALPVSIIFILGRFGNLFLYTLLIYLAIRRLDSGKYIISVIALFPTAFFLSVTYSYDYWLTGFLFLGFSYYFYESKNPDIKIKLSSIIIILGSFVMALSPKAVYFPMMFVLYFLNKSKFKTREGYKLYIIIITIFIFLIIGSFMLPFLITRGGEGDLRGGLDINPSKQVSFIFQNPLIYTKTLLYFIKNYLNVLTTDNYISTFYYLGKVSIHYHFLIILLLIFVVITDKNKQDLFVTNLKYKVIISALSFSTIVLFSTALYISFTAVGAKYILGVQGRYIIPILFPFLYILGSSKIENKINKSHYSMLVFYTISFVLLKGIWDLCISKYN